METLSWQAIEPHLQRGEAWVLSMGGARGVRIGYNAKRECLFLRVPSTTAESVPLIALSELKVEKRLDAGGPVLEVATVTKHFFREFHRFASLVTEEFEPSSQTAAGAILESIKRWRDFLSQKNILSLQEQLGLYGELVLLRGLVSAHGPRAIKAWIGADPVQPARHDFRWETSDIEVKCTRSTKREHTIHGLHQLMPIADHALYIVSVRLEDAGGSAGRSLTDRVEELRLFIRDSPSELDEFNRKLSTRYDDSHADYYRTAYLISGPCQLVPVDQFCPRVTADMLRDRLSASAAGRIGRVTYTIDLDGLGFPMPSSDFTAPWGHFELE